ncbi:sarcosine oxidase subunit gamma family protein [Mesorhizobium xinjiangense]|uniref:sarcosine oxidase subunit gamma family protein n=1 Tax=Mesorhizobium xinjiangense TaxID=2678685 RepID=UPI0012ECFC2A|nr:sarcosine oxidase subunit gamma family protein [Mesorhizobium xinjiangense]
MVEPLSPLETDWKPGHYGHVANGAGVTLSQTQPGSIVQAAAFAGEEKTLIAALKDATGLALPDGAGAGVINGARAAFGIAPGRFLLVDQAEGLADTLSSAVQADTGTLTDLSHGRTAIRVAGTSAQWVLAKLFAIDFALTAFPVANGCSTAHHDIFAHIQRTGETQFDLYVFRSFARSFWKSLCHASEDVGYQVK